MKAINEKGMSQGLRCKRKAQLRGKKGTSKLPFLSEKAMFQGERAKWRKKK